MTKPLVCADFQNADPLGRLRLNCAGTIEDLSRLGLQLEEGLRLTLHDDDIQTEGEVHFSNDEHLWVATIDWGSVGHEAASGTIAIAASEPNRRPSPSRNDRARGRLD